MHTTGLKLDQTTEQMEKGFKLSHQITETFATYYELEKSETKTIFKRLEMAPMQIDPIKPIEINGSKLEFQKVNDLVQRLNKILNIPYSVDLELLLKKMEIGVIYQIDGNKELIFKLNLLKNHERLYVNYHNDIDSIAKRYAKKVKVKNAQLVLLDFENRYYIDLKISNYGNHYSRFYLYHKKNRNGKKSLVYNRLNEINMEDFKSASNEVLFHITME